MTLLERDREKIEEGREEGRKELILKQYNKGLAIEYIAELNEIDIEFVRNVITKNITRSNN